MKQYIVDAFTGRPFAGNPAAVCVPERWPAEESMRKLAMENNLSETAFVVKEDAGYRLRWFTPETEVELCGHATLASAFVILNFHEPEDQVRALQPDQALLAQLEGRIRNTTARGRETDCVSRSFCPKLGIAEDPVCGSAHCQIAAYWAGELGRREITAYQASRRGGFLHCRTGEGGRILISGEAALVAVSEIVAAL